MADSLDALAGRSPDPLMRRLLVEVRAGLGISVESSLALSSASPGDPVLAEFLRLSTRALAGVPLVDYAIVLVRAVGRQGVGKEAVDACLDRLDEASRRILGGHMCSAELPESVAWFHTRLVVVVRDVGIYGEFLQRHADIVLERCADEMYAFLLASGRRPDLVTAEALGVVFSRTGVGSRAETRWLEWIADGRFDRYRGTRGDWSATLYKVLADRWEDPAFARVVAAARSHVRQLLASTSTDEVKAGLYHLVALADVRYPDAGSFAGLTEDVPHASADQRGVLPLIRAALLEVAAYCRDPADPRRDERARARLDDVYDIADPTIIGYLSHGD